MLTTHATDFEQTEQWVEPVPIAHPPAAWRGVENGANLVPIQAKATSATLDIKRCQR